MDLLPNEILLNILGYLDTYDLLQFCEVFKNLEYFLKDKKVISITNWSRRYELQNVHLCKFIYTKMNPYYIKVLNINCIYWIPGQDLRKLLQKLENLEELRAIDTKLGFKCNDVVEYFRLKKLAVSVEDGQFDFETLTASKSLTLLKGLYIKIVLKKEDHRDTLSGFRLFFCNIRQLEELWVQDDHESVYRINYERLVIELKNLKKFVVRSKSILPLYDFSFVGLSKTFECKRCNTEGELIFERIMDRKPKIVRSVFDPKETALEKAWDVFVSLHADLPCGPRDCKLLNLREDINNIQFEELNFCHTVIFCSEKYVDAALQVLQSTNCKYLKRLNFRSCLFQNFQKSKRKNEDDGEAAISFKKVRIGLKEELLKHPFEKVSKNLKHLTELEIYACQTCSGNAVISAYSMIENFEKLEKLTLEIPYFLNGSFLKKVFSTCRHLDSLTLKLSAPNEIFMTNLFQSLECATNLKDFRWEGHNLIIEKLLKSFCNIPTKKLQRLFISCYQLNYTYNIEPPEMYLTFLRQNPQLIFFFLVSSQATTKEITDVQKVLHIGKGGNPAKIFYVKKELGPFLGIVPIPPAHRDIIFNRTRVSVINFNEF